MSHEPEHAAPRRSHGVLPSTACSVLSRQANEPMAGTAPVVNVWLGIEQPGPWGAKALLDSHLPDGLGPAFLEKVAGAALTPLLIRRPGTHADPRHQDPREHRRTLVLAYAGGPAAATPWMVTTVTQGDNELASTLMNLDVEQLVSGTPPEGPWSPVNGRVALICTNGRRDTCCAVSGRLLLDDVIDAHATAPDQVWECSHPGGHRLAPTVVIVPEGLLLGRAAAADVISALAGRAPIEVIRGRSALSPPEQSAELAVMQQLATVDGDMEEGPTLTSVRVADGQPASSDHVSVRVGFGDPTTDARSWLVPVTAVLDPEARPASCAKEPEQRTHWIAGIPIQEIIMHTAGL